MPEGKATSQTKHAPEFDLSANGWWAPENTSVCCDLLWEWNEEILSFYFGRMQKYWALPMQLQSCGSIEDLRRLQSDFIERMIKDYSDEAAQLAKIAGSIQAEDQGEDGEEGEASYEDGLLRAQHDAAQIIEQAKAQADHILAEAQKRASNARAVARKHA